VLVVAWLFGMAARRLKQPAAVGEVTAGVVLAVLATAAGGQLPWLHGVLDSAALAMVAEAGIFLIVLLAGIEMRPAEITENSKDAFFVALGGAALPLVAGVVFGYWVLPESPLRDPQALLLGVAMAVTAIPTTVKVLGELKLLHTRVGRIVVSAAIYDDVIGLMLLAGLTAIIETGEVPDLLSIVWLVAKIAVFFAITVALGVHVYPHVRRRLKALQVASIEFSILMVVGLGYAVLAELLGMHWIMGAFMAGLFFEAPRVGALAYNEMRLLLTGVVGGFLGPLFFASIGLRVDLSAVVAVPGLLAAVIAIAFLGKLIGAGLPARLVGLPGREAVAVGAGMSARGAVELVVLSVAYEAGLFLQQDGDPVVAHLFSVLVIMAVVTTLLSPLLLRQVIR
jgi:Kef-type K+ transport system membrane component KefB